jgi:hypothetical protein
MEAWRAKPEAERKSVKAKGAVAWRAWVDRHKDAIAAGGAKSRRHRTGARALLATLTSPLTSSRVTPMKLPKSG